MLDVEVKCTECVMCSTPVGAFIGGWTFGKHHGQEVVMCDWCFGCMEECVNGRKNAGSGH